MLQRRKYRKRGKLRVNIIKELEDMRKRVLQEINTEFDILIERAAEELSQQPREQVKPYEIRYPLTAGGGIFKGKKPTGLIIGEQEPIMVRTWKQIAQEVMRNCASQDEYRQRLFELAGKIAGRKRVLLATGDNDMRSPLKICEGLYMETHYDAETLLSILTNRILIPIGYDYSTISVTIRNV